MAERVTHKHIERAVAALNDRRGLSDWNKPGHLQYADIRGDGAGYRPGFYATIASGGVANVGHLYRGATMRETLNNLESAS